MRKTLGEDHETEPVGQSVVRAGSHVGKSAMRSDRLSAGFEGFRACKLDDRMGGRVLVRLRARDVVLKTALLTSSWCYQLSVLAETFERA